MAKNRKNQTGSVQLGLALKVVLLCAVIGSAAIGYVWQKSQIDRMGKLQVDREKRLDQLKRDNDSLARQIAILHLPLMLERRAKELNLGLAPTTPYQVVYLTESPMATEKQSPRQFAQRPPADLTP